MPIDQFLGVGRDPKFLGRQIIKNSFVVPNDTFTQGQEMTSISLSASEASFPVMCTNVEIKVTPIALGANVSLPRLEFFVLGRQIAVCGIPASADGADNTFWEFNQSTNPNQISTSPETKALVVKFFASNITGVFTFALNVSATFQEI